MPVGTQRNDRVVQRNADAPAHAHHHRLAIERGDAILEVLHQIGGYARQALVAADQRLHRGPLLLGALGAGFVLILQQRFDLGIDTRLLVLVQLDARQA